MHKPQKNLQEEINAASEKVKVGQLYSHYKDADSRYKVISLAVTESDDKICVIYQMQYGEKIIFVRPLDNWLDQVEWQDDFVPRFRLLDI